MTKSNIIIGIIGAVVVIGFALGVLGFIKSLKNAQDDFSPPEEAVVTFQQTLIDRALARGPHPIEGFDALMLLDIFPGLEKSDFDSVTTGAELEEGMHSYINGELRWKRTVTQPITSAEQTITQDGYATLLVNLSQRLGMPVSSREEVIAIIDKIDIPSDIADHILSKSDLIKVYSPRPSSVIASPLTVWGEARGAWFFEANFQLTLVDWDGRIIAESFASALLNPNDPDATWMTEEFVPFEGTIEFENPSNEADFSKRGALIFQKANPSGLAERADALEIPILFK